MNDNVETFEVNGLIVNIHPDPEPQNPRDEKEFDGLATLMICSHRKYKLGDEHSFKFSDYNSWEELEKAIIKEYKPVVIKTLYLYDHSGITMATKPFECRWDSGKVGFILMTPESVRTNFEVKRITKKIIEKVDSWLESDVKTYDNYLTGNYYGYTIMRKPVNEDEDSEELDACWGFSGIEYCREQATESAQNIK
jgi:hypothetical protein